MKVLNLYAGIGGNRKLWEDVEVTAIELDPAIAKIYQDYFSDDKVIVSDAHQYLLDHYKEFDFIWSSPPCLSHSRINTDGNQKPRYPDMKLYEEIIFLSNNWYKGLYAVENVIPYYKPLVQAQTVDRHLFWANFKIGNYDYSRPFTLRDGNIKKYEDFLGYDLSGYKGEKQKQTLLRNCVIPETGLYILNCARNIITKQNVNQEELFK